MLGGLDIVHSVPTFQAAGTLATGAGNISPAWPTHVANDIGLLFVATINQAVATPSGWNAVTNGSQGAGTGGSIGAAIRLQVFWRRALSNAESAAAVLDGGAGQDGLILTFRGCAASGDPINVAAGNAATSNATAVSIPGATTSGNNCLVVAACAHYDLRTQSGEANASLAGLAERFDASGNFAGLSIVTGSLANAGAYSATTATLNNSSRQGRVSLALLPA